MESLYCMLNWWIFIPSPISCAQGSRSASFCTDVSQLTVTGQIPLRRNQPPLPSVFQPGVTPMHTHTHHTHNSSSWALHSSLPWRCMLWCLRPVWCMALRRAGPAGLGCPGPYPEHSVDSDTSAPLWRPGYAPTKQTESQTTRKMWVCIAQRG